MITTKTTRAGHLLLAAGALTVSACFTPHADYVPTKHIVMFDGDGDPVDPTSQPFLGLRSYRKMPREAFEEYLAILFESIDEYLGHGRVTIAEEVLGEGKQETVVELDHGHGEVQRVLLFIHGGLNGQKGTIDRAAHLYEKILTDEEDGAYPVFINWQSNLMSSYLSHLLFVRQGHNWSWLGLIVAPVVLVKDVVSAVANVPFTILHEFDSFSKGMPYYTSPDQGKAYSVAKTLTERAARLKRDFPEHGDQHLVAAEHAASIDHRVAAVHQASPEHELAAVHLESADHVAWREHAGSAEHMAWADSGALRGHGESESHLAWAEHGLLADHVAPTEHEGQISHIETARHVGSPEHGAWAEHELAAEHEIEAEYLQDPSESDVGLANAGWVILTLPVRLVTATAVDIFGKGAWDAMLRRIELLFERQDQYESGSLSPRPAEGLPRFLERLAAYQEEHPELRVDLVAHSMGTIVANRILDLRLRDATRAPKVSNIVYMASASTTHDFQSSVYPYLVQQPEAKLYMLVLHDKAEVNESQLVGLLPAGSLLVWIDNFLTNVRSHVDFRIGRFTPLMLSLHVIEANLRSRIFIKSFSIGSGDDDDPNQHGEFNDAPFWKESFWTPNWKGEKEGEDCDEVDAPADPIDPAPEETAAEAGPALATR